MKNCKRNSAGRSHVKTNDVNSLKEAAKTTMEMNCDKLLNGESGKQKRHGIKCTPFHGILIGLVLIAIGMIFSLLASTPQNGNSKTKEKIYLSLLNDSTNFNKVCKDIKVNLPSEYFEVNYKNKELLYVSHDDTTSIKYHDTKNYATKVFDNVADIDSTLLTGIDPLVKKEYKDAVDNVTMDSIQTRLCYLYNALSGISEPYLFLGRDDADFTWHYYKASDFPKYKLNLELFCNYLRTHPETDITEGTLKSFVETVDVVYYDYRNDSIHIGNKKYSIKDTTEFINSFKSSFQEPTSGWVCINNCLNRKLIKAIDYYENEDSHIWLNQEQYNKLSSVRWNCDNKAECSVSDIIGKTFIGFGLLVVACFSLISVMRFYRKQDKKLVDSEDIPFVITNLTQEESNHRDQETPMGTNDDSSETIKQLQAEIYELKKANAEAIEKAKEDGRKEGINEIKNSNEYKKLNAESINWQCLSKQTEAKGVVKFLNEMHNKIQGFPQILTLVGTYETARKTVNNKEKLTKVILEKVDQQVGGDSNLATSYIELVKYATDCRNVMPIYEQCQTEVSQFATRKGYNQIFNGGKDLSFWERMAIMLWAMDFTNDILKIFGQPQLPKQIVNNAQTAHKDDIMQIYAARIFNKFMDTANMNPGKFAEEREKLMREKILEIAQKYQISMPEASQYYKAFLQSLDAVYAKIKGEEAFIQKIKANLVDEFNDNEREIMDEGEYLSLLVAMGLHLSDYIKFMGGKGLDYCPNTKYLLSGVTPPNSKFRYKDPAYSGDYTNRVYEWLNKAGIKHLKALIDSRMILP